jgi:YesN/AraC family two-component response regulator
MAIRTLIVDNQNIVRRGLTMFLQTDAAFEIVGEASNGREALRIAGEQQPQLILMDLLMPDMDGVATTKAIRERGLETELVALSSSSDRIS